MTEYLPRESCIKGHLYRIHSRNLSTGVFDGISGFIGIREKFGSRYLFREYHWDNGPPFGTVKPQEDLGAIPEGIPLCEHLEHEADDLWAERDGEKWVPVARRDLFPDEPPHGTRQGFVDFWVDTRERLPDKVYPYLRGNEELFAYLQGKEYKE